MIQSLTTQPVSKGPALTPPRRFAVILTHNRPELLRRCIEAIAPQVDIVIVVDNASEPATDLSIFDGVTDGTTSAGLLINDPSQPPNLPALWNLALAQVDALRPTTRAVIHVAFLCDDAIAPPTWFETVSMAMASTGAAAGCSDPFGHLHEPILKTQQDSDLLHRMVGWAFVLDADRGIAPDPAMRWWWCDTDIDWQARAAGGMVMVGHPALVVPNERPNEHTMRDPALGQQAGDDGITFAAKWGQRPW